LKALTSDRTAIEHVYYTHRLGEKPPFAQVSPPALIEKLVKQELHKEAVLKQVYGLEITQAQLDAEVQRIDWTTRAPAVLAELKAALGNDPARFARTVAKPILVERQLRERFENDDKLHADLRREADKVRDKLLKASAEFRSNPASSAATNRAVETVIAILKQDHTNAVTETTWQLGGRAPEAQKPDTADEIEIRKRFGPNARVLSGPHSEADRKLYFEDLPPDLQNVLRVQLRAPGDVSAVIELPSAFLLYVAKEKSGQSLTVASLSLPKRGYEQWLEDQKSEFSRGNTGRLFSFKGRLQRGNLCAIM